MSVNYYEVLGVNSSASEGEIRDRFRQLARANHPDRYSGADKADAERRFQTLTAAVNVLTNPEKRRQHDSLLSSSASKTAVVDNVQIAKRYLTIGARAYKENSFSTAYENFDLAAKHNPQDPKAWHYLAMAAAKIPAYARQAVQAIEKAVELDTVNPQYLRDAGRICRLAGLSAKAERYFEQALQWDPENGEIQNALAELRQGRGEAGKGFTLFRKG